MASKFDKDEEFVDAESHFSNSNIQLSQSIKEAHESLILFLNNRFEEAKKKMEPHAKRNMYHSLSYCTTLYLQATITRESQHILDATSAVKGCLTLCNKNRRKFSIADSLKFRNKSQQMVEYAKYTDEQCHAELCYAECLLERAFLSFFEDENLIALIKGSLKIRECYKTYKCCWDILKVKEWKDDFVKSAFESGVRLGVGAFNLMISMLPSRILKLLEFIGFKGNKEFGLREMNKACNFQNNIRQPMARLMLLSYHCFIGVLTGMYPYTEHIEESQRLIAPCLSEYKNSAVFVLIRSRIELIRGKFDEAITGYEEAISCQSEWRNLHDICHWELMWAYALQGDWLISMKYAEKLSQQSKWSKATYLYQKAAFLLEFHWQTKETITDDMKKHLVKIFESIPRLMQRFAGKSLPIEKFAMKKSKRYIDQGEYLILPGVELIFVWNGFKIMAYSPNFVKDFFTLCDTTLNRLLSTTNEKTPYYYDNIALATVLKAVCLRYLERIPEAIELMNTVIGFGKLIKEDLYILPYTEVELAQIAYAEGRYGDVKKHTDNAKSYRGYSLESRLHFKIHGIDYQLKKTLSDPNSHCSADSWENSSLVEINKTIDNNNIDDFVDCISDIEVVD